jgi:(p)ppGpp synthase/HD superfamily hydrolase
VRWLLIALIVGLALASLAWTVFVVAVVGVAREFIKGVTRLSPDDPRLLTLARSLAEVAHEGQVRKGTGAPYFTHVERIAKRAGVLGVRAAVVGYLHDTVEDTAVDWRTLGQLFPWEIVTDVKALTRNPGLSAGYPLFPLSIPADEPITNERYKEFIARTIREGSDTALQVKLADLFDNLTDSWIQDKDGLRAKYIKSDVEIRTALRQRGVEPLVF